MRLKNHAYELYKTKNVQYKESVKKKHMSDANDRNTDNIYITNIIYCKLERATSIEEDHKLTC